MRKKNIYILIIILVIIAAGIIGYYYLSNINKLSITTNKGTVKVNDITKNPAQTLPDSVLVYKATADYTLNYYAQDKLFIITIINSDIQAARVKAEADFLATLKIGKDQACRLNVQLLVPFSVNADAAGINFGLSFCPNGKPF
ncbi:MAG: hypothetical protein PHE24_00965 [Patescibacteria group bacterium]|nr:hypothetical protein [Patescibacteria group bacterium]